MPFLSYLQNIGHIETVYEVHKWVLSCVKRLIMSNYKTISQNEYFIFISGYSKRIGM